MVDCFRNRDIEQVAYFDADAMRKSLTYSVKQMLAKEIELEKLRMFESNLGPIIPKPMKPIDEPQIMKPPPPNPATFALKPKAFSESSKVSPSKSLDKRLSSAFSFVFLLFFSFFFVAGIYRWIDFIMETEVEKSS